MKYLSLIILCVFITSCTRQSGHHENTVSTFNYPDSKTWKHGVYSKNDAKKYAELFDGLEVDVIYSKAKNNIYVGRVEADTSKKLPLDDWLSVINNPEKNRFWIDFKNLSAKNAVDAFEVLDPIVKKYKLENKFFIESKDVEALKIAKDKSYNVMLWVENINYWKSKKREDTISVCKLIRKRINELKPDAISCEYTMYPLLCDSFPEQNIHFWDTPKEYTPENVEFTKELCNNRSVKVVLVDYPNPVDK